MSKPDLDTVMARRAAVASELAVLERMRTEMEIEDQELQLAERVLKRLAALPPGELMVSSTGAAGDAPYDARELGAARLTEHR